MKKALNECDQLPADAAPDAVNKASNTLMHWYRRLCYLDVYHIIIVAKVGEAEQQIIMNAQQIQRNNELREEENAPLIETWYDRAQGLIGAVPWPAQDYHPSTASKASPSIFSTRIRF